MQRIEYKTSDLRLSVEDLQKDYGIFKYVLPNRRLRDAAANFDELIDHVREDTGWPLDFSPSDIEFVSRSTFRKRAENDSTRRMGYTPKEYDDVLQSYHARNPRSLAALQAWVANRWLHPTVSGIFLPSENKILLPKKIKLSTERTIQLVIYHELVHAAQYQNFPVMLAALSEFYRKELEYPAETHSENEDYNDQCDRVGAIGSLLEAQPWYLQDERFQISSSMLQIGVDITDMSLYMLARMITGRKKVQPSYVADDDIKEIIRILYREQRSSLDTIFSHPTLAEVLYRTAGKIYLSFPEAKTESEKISLKTLAYDLRALNPYRDELTLLPENTPYGL